MGFQSLRIGVDIDGIISNTVDELVKMVKQQFGVDMHEIAGQKEKVDYWPGNWPEIQAINGCTDYINACLTSPGIYRTAKPMEGAVPTLKKWQQAGHRLWLVSARPRNIKTATFEWLRRWGLKSLANAETVVLNDQHRKVDWGFKPATANELKLQVFVEDNAETIKKMDQIDSIIRGILLDFPYNCHCELGSKTKVAQNWSEIDQLVEELASVAQS